MSLKKSTEKVPLGAHGLSKHSNTDETIKTLSSDHSSKSNKRKENSKLAGNRWTKVVNAIRVTKQKQKVRFIIDPNMNNDISECPIEVDDCTVDESVMHYVDSVTKTNVAFCTKERFFWEILNSNVWLNRMRVTQGKLQTTILDSLTLLKERGAVRAYQHVTYTTSSNQMRKFLRRGTLQKISKQFTRESTPNETSYRSTMEYFCQPDKDIFKLHPRLSSLTYIDPNGQPILVTNSQKDLNNSGNVKLKSPQSVLGDSNSITFIDETSVSQPTISLQNQPIKDLIEKTTLSQVRSTSSLWNSEVDSNPESMSKSEETTSLKTTDEHQDYFLPRVNSTFTEDLLRCVSEFKVKKESVTNSKTWHTVHEIVIVRM